jgi:triacylglycerol lipase
LGDEVGGEGSVEGRATTSTAFLLAHGFGGDREMGFGDGVAAALSAAGHQVYKAEVPATDSVAVRAAVLATEIDAFLLESGATDLHIIAHSMGGLDARYAITTLGYASKIKSLTTISSPHRGTPLADVGLGLIASGPQTQQAALDGLAALLEGTPLDPAAFERGVAVLTEASAPAFNAANPDAPGVVYWSYAGLSTLGGLENPNAAAACAGAAVPAPDQLRPLLFLPAPIVSGTERRPNDGVVPVDSATWGTFRGCIPADHLDETGALDTGNSGIDAPTFYVELAAELAALP